MLMRSQLSILLVALTLVVSVTDMLTLSIQSHINVEENRDKKVRHQLSFLYNHQPDWFGVVDVPRL